MIYWLALTHWTYWLQILSNIMLSKGVFLWKLWFSCHQYWQKHLFLMTLIIKLLTKLTLIFSWSNAQFYESGIFCLFIFWVFFPDKIVKLLSKYSQKCQYRGWVAKFAIMLHTAYWDRIWIKSKESEEY